MSLRSLESKLLLNLHIDTIASYSRKQERVGKLKELFELKPITDNSKLSTHLKNKLDKDKTITGGLYAANAPFNFAILNSKATDYKKAYFIAYGLASYKKPLTNEARSLLNEIFTICPPTSIDLAFDTPVKPNIEALANFGRVVRHYGSSYLNCPALYGVDRVIIYDKATKDGLQAPLWRVEFRLPVNQKLKYYEPPIEEMERLLIAVCEDFVAI